MSNSKLAKKMLVSRNYDTGRDGFKIKHITIHHTAGIVDIEELYRLMNGTSRQVSSHYGIGNDGRIGQYVLENNTAWTNGNWVSNCTSVTIETSNCKTGGKWLVSDKALQSLIELVADIGYRNNLGKLVPKQNVQWHSLIVATTCPGDYLRSKMSYICKEANKINELKELSYTTGDYETLGAMNVRAGAGTLYRRKKVKELTADGKKNATKSNPNDYATYKKGTIFTATKIIKNTSGNIWAKSPSGYICIATKNGKKYCKKVK